MTRVMVVDPNASLTSTVVRCLRGIGVTAAGHTRADSARPELDAELYDLLLLDGSLVSSIDDLRARRVVVMVAYPDRAWQQQLIRRHSVLLKPFTSAELMSLLQHEFGTMIRPDPSLLEALHHAHRGQSSTCLILSDEVQPSEVYMIAGEIHDARRGHLRGESALRVLLCRAVRLCSSRAIDACQRTIRQPFRPLLLELLRQIEELEGQGSASAGEEMQ